VGFKKLSNSAWCSTKRYPIVAWIFFGCWAKYVADIWPLFVAGNRNYLNFSASNLMQYIAYIIYSPPMRKKFHCWKIIITALLNSYTAIIQSFSEIGGKGRGDSLFDKMRWFLPWNKQNIARIGSHVCHVILVRQIEDQNYGKHTISWDNSILPSHCALKPNKYVSVCGSR
jgi:hypothetical protein